LKYYGAQLLVSLMLVFAVTYYSLVEVNQLTTV